MSQEGWGKTSSDASGSGPFLQTQRLAGTAEKADAVRQLGGKERNQHHMRCKPLHLGGRRACLYIYTYTQSCLRNVL